MEDSTAIGLGVVGAVAVVGGVVFGVNKLMAFFDLRARQGAETNLVNAQGVAFLGSGVTQGSSGPQYSDSVTPSIPISGPNAAVNVNPATAPVYNPATPGRLRVLQCFGPFPMSARGAAPEADAKRKAFRAAGWHGGMVPYPGDARKKLVVILAKLPSGVSTKTGSF